MENFSNKLRVRKKNCFRFWTKKKQTRKRDSYSKLYLSDAPLATKPYKNKEINYYCRNTKSKVAHSSIYQVKQSCEIFFTFRCFIRQGDKATAFKNERWKNEWEVREGMRNKRKIFYRVNVHLLLFFLPQKNLRKLDPQPLLEYFFN